MIIDEYLTTEIQAGRVLGPLPTPALSYLHVSQFGVIPKKNKIHAWRLILDLSYPLGHSVNDGIDKNEFPVTYSKVDDANALIVKYGKSALMGKVDIKNAYRIVPIHPDDHYLLGMKWRNRYFVDLALPFGLRSAPYIFNSLADLFHWIIVNNFLVPDLLHYLDDYFTLGPPASPVCAQLLHAIQNAANDIGIPLAPEKIEGPSTCLIFLGTELDSDQMTARLPANKLSELLILIQSWVSKKHCKRKELESLVGKLSHACYVVPAGRTFLRRLINLLRDSKRYWKTIRVTRECQLDLEWWSDFLLSWDGVYFFDLPEWVPLADFELSSDASGKKGFGVYYNGVWFAKVWLEAQQPLGMAYKELFPIVIACHIWGPSWSRKRIKFWCDNQSVVHILQSGTSKDVKIMHLVRALYLITAKYNFRVCASHIPGKTNRIADSLSRFNLQEFFRLAPNANPTPVEIPAGEFASTSDLQTLKDYTNSLLFHGLAKSTRRTYSALQRKFLDFCYKFGFINDSGSPLPVNENTLMHFAAHLSRTLKASSIKVYLSGVRSMHIEHGFHNPLENCFRLERVLRGIKRLQGTGTKPTHHDIYSSQTS